MAQKSKYTHEQKNFRGANLFTKEELLTKEKHCNQKGSMLAVFSAMYDCLNEEFCYVILYPQYAAFAFDQMCALERGHGLELRLSTTESQEHAKLEKKLKFESKLGVYAELRKICDAWAKREPEMFRSIWGTNSQHVFGDILIQTPSQTLSKILHHLEHVNHAKGTYELNVYVDALYHVYGYEKIIKFLESFHNQLPSEGQQARIRLMILRVLLGNHGIEMSPDMKNTERFAKIIPDRYLNTILTGQPILP